MATITLSKFAKRELPTVTAGCAGSVVVQDYFVDLAAAQIVSGDIVDLGTLPAYHTVVDAILIADQLDSNVSATLTLDVGIMSGAPGSADATRTCGDELFDGADTAQAGGLDRMTNEDGFLIKPTELDRSIGVKFASAAATAKDGRLRLRVFMTAADHKVEF